MIVADRSVRTLKEMGRRRVYRAVRGRHGQGSGKDGARGEDAVIRVPVGTQVRTVTGEMLADLDEEGRGVVAAGGGLGGRGNRWFARATYRAPRIAQRGQAGEEREVQLDLKLLADVGIVGLPNAGKSTLLGAMSAARPKVAAYPFTTVEPVLGVVDVGFERFVMADVPGLIEGAHDGAGMGLDFLRHIERSGLIVHVLGGERPDPLADWEAVNHELAEYSDELARREQVVVLNKVDIREVKERVRELTGAFAGRGLTLLPVSATERRGTEELARRLIEMLAARKREPVAERPETTRPRPTMGRRFEVSREGRAFRVSGERIVAFAEMMPVDQEEGRQELWWRLGRWGVSGAVRRAGAKAGDAVRLGRVELEWPG